MITAQHSYTAAHVTPQVTLQAEAEKVEQALAFWLPPKGLAEKKGSITP